ncbi:MAG: Ig-like domain-containing protein, partial [Lachnospiraceae bacterium]|nr:Ig-like domain-containing protein [Lachnospiraceae bacterium]
VVENKEQAKLNETQKESLKNFTSVQPFQAYFESGGKEIHDFKGGKATVSIKFTPENGRDVKHYHMYYVPLNGIIERYVTRYLDGMLSFVTTHFSDYAIVYDETVENETGKEEATPSPSPSTAPTAEPSETAMPTGTATPAPTTEPTGTATPAPAVSAEEKATAALDLNAGLKVIHKGKTATVQWGKVDGADFYRVYAGYCGGKVSLVKTVKGNAKCRITIKKLNGKSLSATKNIKVYVAAYRKAEVKSGTGTVVKNVRIAKTITGHVVGKNNKKYSNAKKIKLVGTSYTLNKGKKAQIKAKTVLEYPKRKQLSDAHAKEFRYATTDKSIATVSKTGKITAKKKGSCIIYVYARNGLAKKIKITVK